MRKFVETASGYIADVLAGKFPTCKWTRAACQREFDDLSKQDWPYYFDENAATIPCEFLEMLTHVSGEKGESYSYLSHGSVSSSLLFSVGGERIMGGAGFAAALSNAERETENLS